MKIKRTGKFRVRKSHPDYELIKIHTVEVKEIYNYANYIIRQIFFKNSGNHKYSLEFIHEYSELEEDFETYLKENGQFTSTIHKLNHYHICSMILILLRHKEKFLK